MNNKDSGSVPRRICICDSEVSYGEHLMEYLRSEGRLPCEVYLYTSRESCCGWRHRPRQNFW